jgi:hypothetical protein
LQDPRHLILSTDSRPPAPPSSARTDRRLPAPPAEHPHRLPPGSWEVAAPPPATAPPRQQRGRRCLRSLPQVVPGAAASECASLQPRRAVDRLRPSPPPRGLPSFAPAALQAGPTRGCGWKRAGGAGQSRAELLFCDSVRVEAAPKSVFHEAPESEPVPK